MTSEQFLLSLPEKVDPNLLEGLETNFHFILKKQDGTSPKEFTVMVKNRKVFSEKGLHGDPACVVKTSDENLIKLLKGELNPMMAMLTGKLKISNQGEMLKYAKIFGLM